MINKLRAILLFLWTIRLFIDLRFDLLNNKIKIHWGAVSVSYGTFVDAVEGNKWNDLIECRRVTGKMNITTNTKMVTLLGTPLCQSFAARMQNKGYEAAGLAMRQELMDILAGK